MSTAAQPVVNQMDQPQQTETIDSLAGRIKAKYPDYSDVDNGELVQRVIAKYPEYQTRLKGEEVQKLAVPGYDANETFTGQSARVLGEQAKGVGQSLLAPWTTAKQFYDAERQRGGGTLASLGAGTAGLLSKAIPGMTTAQDMAQTYQASRARGYSPIASAGQAAGPLVNYNPDAAQQAAARGSMKGVLANAAVPMAEVAIGAGLTTKPGQAVADFAGKPVRAIAQSVDRLRVPEAPKALTQAIQPGVNIPRAQESIGIAGPRLQQVRQAMGVEFKTPADLLEGIKEAKKQVWGAVNDRLGPVKQLSADTSPIADAMEKSISGRVERQYPEQAAKIRERAATYRGTLPLDELESSIQDANDDLKNFYKRPSPSDSPVNADMKASQAEVQAARKLLDQKVQDLSGSGIADFKREYGALRDVERATAKQNAVATRQKGASLWEGLAALHAAGDFMSGNALGAAKGVGVLALGKRLANLRDPSFLINEAFQGNKAFRAASPIPAAPAIPPPKGLLTSGPLLTPRAPDTSGPIEPKLPENYTSSMSQQKAEGGSLLKPQPPTTAEPKPPAIDFYKTNAPLTQPNEAPKPPAQTAPTATPNPDFRKVESLRRKIEDTNRQWINASYKMNKAKSSSARSTAIERSAAAGQKLSLLKDQYRTLLGQPSQVEQQAAPPPAPAPRPKGRMHPTSVFDALPDDQKQAIKSFARDIPTMPQTLREEMVKKYERYAEPGGRLVERIAQYEKEHNGTLEQRVAARFDREKRLGILDGLTDEEHKKTITDSIKYEMDKEAGQ